MFDTFTIPLGPDRSRGINLGACVWRNLVDATGSSTAAVPETAGGLPGGRTPIPQCGACSRRHERRRVAAVTHLPLDGFAVTECCSHLRNRGSVVTDDADLAARVIDSLGTEVGFQELEARQRDESRAGRTHRGSDLADSPGTATARSHIGRRTSSCCDH